MDDAYQTGPEPKIPTDTKVLGIFQADIIIRTGIIQAIRDIRANPWLLDYCFASLNMDPLTAARYGTKEIERARDWFQRTEIPVSMDYRMDSFEGTCITISLQDSAEAENTWSDTHYEPYEATEGAWPILAGPFQATSYDPATGLMVVPTFITDNIILVAGMTVLTDAGVPTTIIDVPQTGVIQIGPGITDSFSKTLIKSGSPQYTTQLESVSFAETYNIGVHTMGDPTFLSWLYSIVMFILLRYKQQYFETRGLERTTVAAQAFQQNQQTGKETMRVRFIRMTGFVRNMWPKVIEPNVRVSEFSPFDIAKVNGAQTPIFIPEDGFTTETTPFLTEQD